VVTSGRAATPREHAQTVSEAACNARHPLQQHLGTAMCALAKGGDKQSAVPALEGEHLTPPVTAWQMFTMNSQMSSFICDRSCTVDGYPGLGLQNAAHHVLPSKTY
jgi:hypothetical protein